MFERFAVVVDGTLHVQLVACTLVRQDERHGRHSPRHLLRSGVVTLLRFQRHSMYRFMVATVFG
ncbi:hypothetical protein DPV74_05645 [Burkholderia sp. HAN2018]|nr:hypothetical protein [Burkholderia sp. HAN2018]